MKPAASKFVAILSKTPLLVFLVVVFLLGYTFRTMVADAPPAARDAASTDSSEDVAEEVWTCSMHPEIRLPNPGNCPKCGMDLIRAEVTKATEPPKKAKKKPKYACSMFCVPPLPLPGSCPICGMEMVEVEVAGGDEGDGERPTLTLSPRARKLAEIQTVAVERKTAAAEIRLFGKIDYDETRLSYITAWVPGRLERLFVDYTGVPVR
ncbi:MAG: hypothetical protein IID36_11615, partial [Planctomycetes bacterium]|nr:hypothetical protein [Planctomycetota bacterium]